MNSMRESDAKCVKLTHSPRLHNTDSRTKLLWHSRCFRNRSNTMSRSGFFVMGRRACAVKRPFTAGGQPCKGKSCAGKTIPLRTTQGRSYEYFKLFLQLENMSPPYHSLLALGSRRRRGARSRLYQ